MVRRRRLNRTLVVEQAIALADAGGDATAVSLNDLAQALNIRTPSLYNHIAGQDDLRRAMTVYTAQELLQALRMATVGKAGREALFAAAEAYRAFVHKHPGTHALTVRAPEPDETALAAVSQELVQFLMLLMGSLGLTGDDAVHAIRGLRAVLYGFTSLEAAGGYKMPLDTDESFRRLLTAYLDGLD